MWVRLPCVVRREGGVCHERAWHSASRGILRLQLIVLWLCVHVMSVCTCVSNLIKFFYLHWQVSITCLPDLPPSNMTIVYNTNNDSLSGECRNMHGEVLVIEALPFVSSLSKIIGTHKQHAGLRALLFCYTSTKHKSCGNQVGGLIYTSSERLTLLDCLQTLHKRLQQKHNIKCINTAPVEALKEEAAAALSYAAAKPDIDKAMMEFASANNRSEIANKDLLVAQQTKNAAERELQLLKQIVHLKRKQIELGTGNTDEQTEMDMDDSDVTILRREATQVYNRHVKQFEFRDDTLPPRTGKQGYLEHSQLGLLGSIAYWLHGDLALVPKMIAALTDKLNIGEQVFEVLQPTSAIWHERLRLIQRLSTF